MSVITDYLNYTFNIVLGNIFGEILAILVLFWLLFYIWHTLTKQRNNGAYMNALKWVFLEVKVDEVNEKSPLAMEQIFVALHAIHQNFSWGETLNGRSVLYFSCEIVSLGGKVSYIFKIPERYRNLLESAIFAQYPKAEINEVEDYLRNLPHHYDPDHVDFDFWGTQWNKKKDNAYPIRTYASDGSYEHGAQETFVDPLSNLLEAMSNLQPHELLVWQIVAKPVDDKWKEHVTHLLDKLKGEPVHHEEGLFWKAVFFIPDLLATILVQAVTPPTEEKHSAPVKKEEGNKMMQRTDVEKQTITAIQHGLGKIGYEVKIRGFYLAPKDKFNRGLRVPEIVGAVRNFDDVNLNGLKPDLGHTWTDKSYKISEKLERPYIKQNILVRKRHMLHNFTSRSNWRGSGKTILNVEELATIFHFPQSQYTRVSQLEKVHTVKSAPPMDLPIM